MYSTSGPSHRLSFKAPLSPSKPRIHLRSHLVVVDSGRVSTWGVVQTTRWWEWATPQSDTSISLAVDPVLRLLAHSIRLFFHRPHSASVPRGVGPSCTAVQFPFILSAVNQHVSVRSPNPSLPPSLSSSVGVFLHCACHLRQTL